MLDLTLILGHESANAAVRAYEALTKFIEYRAGGHRFRPVTPRFVEFVAENGRFGGSGAPFTQATAKPSKTFLRDFNAAVESFPGALTVIFEHGWPIIQMPVPEAGE